MNKPAETARYPVVRRPAPAPPAMVAGDRRVRRTRQAIVVALVELVLEKRYDAITIQELLDRANVGRSTFYAHYRGKDDLLLRSFEHLLARLDFSLGNDPARVAPVRELFQHVREMDRFHRALARAHLLDRTFQVGTRQLGVTIARRLASRPLDFGAAPVDVLAVAYAGALFALLRWWMDHDMPHSAERMDEFFHWMILPR